MSKLKAAIIGAGSISRCHIEAYKKLDNVEICAVCDVNQKRAEEKSKMYNIKNVYTDYKEMLLFERPDCVSVCTWNDTHAPVSIAALESGANVLCEKPMAMNTEDAQKMLEVSKKMGKLLMIGFVRRFGENAQYLKELTENGELGEIYYAKAGCIRRCGNPGGWFSDSKRSGGGPLIDLGVHMIDLVRFLMGKPKATAASGATYDKIGSRSGIKGIQWYKSADYSEFNDVEDFATGMIRFDNGATVSVETSWVQNIKEDYLYLQIYGTKAGAMMEPELELYSEKNGYLIQSKPVINPNTWDFQHNFDSEIKHYIDCIENGIACLNPAEDGVEIMKILDAIYKSSKEGMEVRIS